MKSPKCPECGGPVSSDGYCPKCEEEMDEMLEDTDLYDDDYDDDDDDDFED